MVYKQSDIWRRANHLTLQLKKLSEKFPESDQYGMGNLLREDSEEVLLGLEAGITQLSCEENIDHFQSSYLAALRLQRELMVSKYLEYLDVDTFVSLQTEIDNVLVSISGHIRHLNFLNHALSPEVAYSYSLILW